MGWSTSQLAELAGTSVRTVRRYHDVDLLPEPERRSNGYKSYGVAHLVRVLRIKRLTGLGLSLSQIAALGEDDEHPEEALRALDAELATTIDRLQGVRDEVAEILARSAPTDLPAELGEAMASAELTETDRSFTVVASRVFSPAVLDAYGELIQGYKPDPASVEFDNLPADADEATRQDLAERMRTVAKELLYNLPALREMYLQAPRGPHYALRAIGAALKDLYNPAQIDVLIRTNL